MLKIFFALFMLLGFSTAHAYLGYEADQRQRDWMMNTVFAPPPKVEKRPANYNNVFEYDIYNKSGQYISKINFRHATSTDVTSVDTLSEVPRIRQQYGLDLKIYGLRNGADNQWRLVQGYDTSFYMINIPVYGANSNCCTATHGEVDMQVIWANGTVKNYRLPYPRGTVYVRTDYSIFVRLGIGTNLSLCEKVLYPTP